MTTHCINLTSAESLGFVNKRVSILWRPVKGAPCNPEAYLLGVHKGIWGIHADVNRDDGVFRVKQPYQPGDVLIGREAWQYYDTDGQSVVGICYKASFNPKVDGSAEDQEAVKWFDVSYDIAFTCGSIIDYMEVMGESWRSAATMPRWAARHRHVIKSVGVKRCQDVTYGEMIDSGYGEPDVTEQGTERLVNVAYTFRNANKKAWDANLWMWMYEVEEAT
jgi:hypothetical protein